MSRKPTTPYVVLLLLALSTSASPAPAAEATSYSCRFTEGAAFSFGEGGFAEAPVKALAFRIVDVVPGSAEARLEIDGGSAALKVAQALGARHFLEVAVEGYLNVTTIYDAAGADGAFAAVHSRHLAVVGEPFVAQYRGTCRALP